VPHPFQVVRQLFEAALDLPAEQRPAWLHTAAHGDAALIAEVERLLALDTATSPVLDRALTPPSLPAPFGERLIGARIGSFRILRVLGSGGMGTVFEAEQDKPHRLVALKVMRHGFHGPRARTRFEYEAEILARLQHPGIAQVYEAATFDDGGTPQPYFAMERIEGAQPLDNFVQQHRLDPLATIVLFEKVCEAVHYGHQRGVVHRDLKPANVLVEPGGQPKLIDFGIARAEGPTFEATLTSESGSGTLAYMSPEQFEQGGAATDIRVDVYALGVILFQLLTGRLPLELTELPLGAATDAIRHREPPRLSQCAAARNLPPDLDWIVQKAMAKDPELRFASAQALLDDLRRLRAGEPVLAGPPSTTYRLRKFVRRNRIAVGGAAAVVVALIAGTIATTVGWSRAVAAEELAEGRRGIAVAAEALAEARRVEAQQIAENLWQVTHLQADLLGSARGDRNIKLADVIERYQKRIESMDLPDPVAAELHTALAISFDSLGLTDRAQEQFALARKRVARDPQAMRRTALVGKTHYATMLGAIGKLQEAEPLLREALAEHVAMYGEQSKETAIARANLAGVLLERGDHAGAEQLYRVAMPVMAATLGKQHFTTITALSARASALHRLQRAAEAAELHDEACALAAQHLGAEDPTTLSSENAYAVFLLETGKVDEALARFEALAEVRTKVSGPAHPSTLRIVSNIAVCHERQERFGQAEAIHRRILEARRNAGGGKELADLITRFNLAVALHKQDTPEKVQDALDVLVRTIGDAEQVLPADNWRLAVFRQHQGIVLRKLRRFAEAEVALERARAVLERTLGADDMRTRFNWSEFATLYEAWDRPNDAAKWRSKLAAK